MSEELDRKIAELVMGETKPDRKPTWLQETTEAWKVVSWVWAPKPFSTDLDEAMRAVNKYFSIGHLFEPPLLQTYYDPTAEKWAWTALLVSWDEEARDWMPNEVITLGHTLPEAICNLLVALVESNSG